MHNQEWAKRSSTDIYLQKVQERWPNPQIGDVFEYGEVAAVIGADPNDRPLLRRVVNRWEKYLMATKLMRLKNIINKGWEVPDHRQRLVMSQKRGKKALKQVKEQAKTLATVDREELDSVEKAHYDHTVFFAGKVQACMVQEARGRKQLVARSVGEKQLTSGQ